MTKLLEVLGIKKNVTIFKGRYIHFKTGTNKKRCIEKGDILQGVFSDEETYEQSLGYAKYLGGDIKEPASFELLNTINY